MWLYFAHLAADLDMFDFGSGWANNPKHWGFDYMMASGIARAGVGLKVRPVRPALDSILAISLSCVVCLVSL